MTRRTIGLAFAALLLAAPAWAQARYQTDREMQMQRQEQMRQEQMRQEQIRQEQMQRDSRTQRDMQARARGNTSVTVEELRDQYAAVADRRERRATKLSAEDYRELAEQREELNELIRRIESGGQVGAGDVDRALGNETVY